MKEITRKKFIGGMAATVALGWRGAFAAPARRQRNYDGMTWWDPYVEDITDVDTYLRRKFRQDVTDKSTGRHTFTTWKHWDKNDGLLPSGLLGPVRIVVRKKGH